MIRIQCDLCGSAFSSTFELRGFCMAHASKYCEEKKNCAGREICETCEREIEKAEETIREEFEPRILKKLIKFTTTRWTRKNDKLEGSGNRSLGKIQQ